METNRITQQRIHWNAAQDKTMFLRLPLKERERRWLTEQMEVLSVKEQYQLAAAIRNTEQLKELAGKTGLELSAAILSRRPEVAVEAINCFLNLHDYEVCFPAGSYEELGRYHLTYESGAVDDIRPFLDMEQLGRRCAELHPGCFLDDCYVRHPQREMQPIYDGQTLPAAEVMDWSLRLKLASPAVYDEIETASFCRLPETFDDTAERSETLRHGGGAGTASPHRQGGYGSAETGNDGHGADPDHRRPTAAGAGTDGASCQTLRIVQRLRGGQLSL